ncbi:MAG: hypothetical protein ACT4OI_03000 [Methanobacteriota archaeon]
MKYYDEERMRDVRKALDSKVLKWPGVATREMMGCLCYFRGKKFFAFLVTDGVVLTKLNEGERSRLSKQSESKPFEMAGRTAASWIQVRMTKPGDLPPVLPYIRTSYEAASARREP